MPVIGASKNDYHPDSFWYYPWGRSVTHKGVDIFTSKGTQLIAPVSGFVMYAGEMGVGGKVVLVIGPKWHLHYLAHLDSIQASPLSYVDHDSIIGTVGDTGNAKGKPPHLHYSLITIIPYPWRIDDDIQGWKKMFFLDPSEYWEM